MPRRVPFHPDADAVVADLADAIAGVLGTDLTALWVAGSLVVGDFDPDLSDIDMFAVTPAAPTPDQLEALRAMHERFAQTHPAWNDRIEAVYFTAPDLRDFRHAVPRFPVTSPGEPFNVRNDALIDWAQELSLIRTHGVTLHGALPTEVIPAVTRDEFIDNCLRYVREIAPRADAPLRAGMESYLVLTAARALHAFEGGPQRSKRAAGLWLADAYPQWASLADLALTWRYEASRTPRPASPCTAPFLRFIEARMSHTT